MDRGTGTPPPFQEKTRLNSKSKQQVVKTKEVVKSKTVKKIRPPVKKIASLEEEMWLPSSVLSLNGFVVQNQLSSRNQNLECSTIQTSSFAPVVSTTYNNDANYESFMMNLAGLQQLP